jgi:cell fate regulator YaaT (PSP1 superfamily)
MSSDNPTPPPEDTPPVEAAETAEAAEAAEPEVPKPPVEPSEQPPAEPSEQPAAEPSDRPPTDAPGDGRNRRGGSRKGRARHFLWLAFSPAGHIHHVPVDPRRFTLRTGDLAVVETDRGLAVARVLREPTLSDELTPSRRVQKVVRPAREPDLITHAAGKAREPDLLAEVKKTARRIKPDIRVLGVDYQSIGNKITIYFASEQRVDFRALVRELGQRLGLRIEMRQIGVRDEAKRVGGLGHCGRELCCGTFLSEFCAVSIRMAKDQNLALSPNKISGLCGRLMCCLSYEHAEYACLRKGLPKTGKRIQTTEGPGRVLSVDVLQQQFSFLGDGGTRQTLGIDAIERDEKGLPIRPPPPGEGAPPRGRPGPRGRKPADGPPRTDGPRRPDGPRPKPKPKPRPKPKPKGEADEEGGQRKRRGGGRRSRRARGRKPRTGGKEPSE